MKTYRVKFLGFIEVQADTENEAERLACEKIRYEPQLLEEDSEIESVEELEPEFEED